MWLLFGCACGVVVSCLSECQRVHVLIYRQRKGEESGARDCPRSLPPAPSRAGNATRGAMKRIVAAAEVGHHGRTAGAHYSRVATREEDIAPDFSDARAAAVTGADDAHSVKVVLGGDDMHGRAASVRHVQRGQQSGQSTVGHRDRGSYLLSRSAALVGTALLLSLFPCMGSMLDVSPVLRASWCAQSTAAAFSLFSGAELLFMLVTGTLYQRGPQFFPWSLVAGGALAAFYVQLSLAVSGSTFGHAVSLSPTMPIVMLALAARRHAGLRKVEPSPRLRACAAIALFICFLLLAVPSNNQKRSGIGGALLMSGAFGSVAVFILAALKARRGGGPTLTFCFVACLFAGFILALGAWALEDVAVASRTLVQDSIDDDFGILDAPEEQPLAWKKHLFGWAVAGTHHYRIILFLALVPGLLSLALMVWSLRGTGPAFMSASHGLLPPVTLLTIAIMGQIQHPSSATLLCNILSIVSCTCACLPTWRVASMVDSEDLHVDCALPLCTCGCGSREQPRDESANMSSGTSRGGSSGHGSTADAGRLFGVDLSNLSPTMQMLSTTLLAVVFSIAGAQLMHMIKKDLNQSTSGLVTLITSAVWCICAVLEIVVSGTSSRSGNIRLLDYAKLSALTFVGMYLTNWSLAHISYSLRIIFKSTKIVVVMALRTAIECRLIYSRMDVLAAVCLTMAACLFGAGDALSSIHFQLVGILMIALATTADAMAGLFEEMQLFKNSKNTRAEVILYSNVFASLWAVGALLIRSDLGPALDFATTHASFPACAAGAAVALYVSLSALLLQIQLFGAVAAEASKTLRKICTVLVGFIFIGQVPNRYHAIAIMLILAAAYVRAQSKKARQAKKTASNVHGGTGSDETIVVHSPTAPAHVQVELAVK